MGVRNLTAFVKEHNTLRESKTFTRKLDGESSEPEVLVVDAWSFLYNLAAESRIPSIYGGEYEDFTAIVVRICRAWIAVGLVPTFVFDGAYLEAKLPEVQRRIQNKNVDSADVFYRTSPAGRASVGFHAKTVLLPALAQQACVDVLLSLRDEGVECFFADGEADPECAGLAAHYKGYVLSKDSDYMIFNAAHKGYIPMDDLIWAEPDLESYEGQDEVDNDDGFQTVSHSKKRYAPPPGVVCSIIPPEDFASLTVSIYHPQALAKHLRISAGLLPLMAAILGNDFTTSAKLRNLFPHSMQGSDRIRRVADSIRNSIYPSSRPSRQRAKRRDGLVPSDKVTNLITSVVNDLAVRDMGEREVDEIVEMIRESIFYYIVPEDFPGPGPWSGLEIEPANEEQAKVQKRFLKAYRKGQFSNDLIGPYTTGTSWPWISLEDPDIKTSQEIVGTPIRQWTYAILNSGVDGVGREDMELVETSPSDDELIDVVEEPSDDDEEVSLEGDSEAPLSPTSLAGYSDASFDPLTVLRQQLEGLRSQATGSGAISNGGALDASSHSNGIPPRHRGPTSVSEYIRRGGKLRPVKVPVRRLSDLVSELERSNSTPSESSLLEYLSIPMPVQLQSSSMKLTLFLRILNSDTQRIRALPPQWILFAAALRSTVIAAATRLPSSTDSGNGRNSLRYKAKWKKEEARAFIASLQVPVTFTPSASTPDHHLQTSYAGDARLEPFVMHPSELSSRSLQLTALVLAGIESVSCLAQALLLKDEVLPTRSVARYFSGKRFHWYLAQISSSSPSAHGAKAMDGAFEKGLEHYPTQGVEKRAVWEAVSELAGGLETDHWAEETWSISKNRANSQTPTPKKISTSPAKPPPSKQKHSSAVTKKSRFDLLASLGDMN